MSWDVILLRTKTNAESMANIRERDMIPFVPAEIAGEVQRIGTMLSAAVRCSDPLCPEMKTDTWSMVFHADNEPCYAVLVEVNGEKDPAAVFQSLCGHLHARAFDTVKGDFMDFQQASGFVENWT